MADVRTKQPFSVNGFSCQINIGSTIDTTFWTKVSAIKKNYGSSTYSDGQTNIKYTLPGSITYENVTISRPFTEDDDVLVGSLIQMNARGNFADVFIQPMYRDGFYSAPIGGQVILKSCSLVSFQMLDQIDTVGDDVAMTEVVLAPGWITSNGSKKWWAEIDGASIRNF